MATWLSTFVCQQIVILYFDIIHIHVHFVLLNRSIATWNLFVLYIENKATEKMFYPLTPVEKIKDILFEIYY